MVLAVTATEIPGKWAVRLTATGATGTVDWFRDPNIPVGTGLDIIDRTVPLNKAATWFAVDDTATKVTGSLTIASTLPVLSSSVHTTAYQVTIIKQTPNRWRARSVWHPVIEKTSGPVVSVFPAEWRDGELQIDLPNRALRTNLLGMFMEGDPLILRATCPDRVDDLTFLPLEWSDPWVPDDGFTRQRLDVRYQSVTAEAPGWAVPVQWTYQDALSAHATYQVWLNTYGTYDDLLAGVP